MPHGSPEALTVGQMEAALVRAMDDMKGLHWPLRPGSGRSGTELPPLDLKLVGVTWPPLCPPPLPSESGRPSPYSCPLRLSLTTQQESCSLWIPTVVILCTFGD